MSNYVLETRDLLGVSGYYAGNWNDVSDVVHAKRYTLDEALDEVRLLKRFGGRYRVVRLGEDGNPTC